MITSLQIITTAFTQSRDAHPAMPAMLPMQQQPLQPFSSFPPMHPMIPGAMVPGMQPASIPVTVAQQVEFAGPAEEAIDSAVETVLVGDTLLVGGGGGGEA